MLEKGAHVNAFNRDGNTPLFVAALAGHKNEMLLLLEHGADVNQVNYMGSSPLMTACFFGQRECVEVLLSHAATDIELRQTKTGDVALHAAAYTGRHEIVALLLKKGAKKDESTRTLVIEAKGQCAACVYVKRVLFNGVVVVDTSATHTHTHTIAYSELMKGGHLVFEMSSTV